MQELRNRVIFIVMITVLFMAGGHLLDVGDIINDNGNGTATNGFFDVDASKVYHGGYYLMYAMFILITILYVNLLIKHNYEKWMKKNQQ